MDVNAILKCAQNHSLIVTCEEHNVTGGFGGAVAEVMAENPSNAALLRIGMADEYCVKVGDQKYLRDQYGMSGEKIATKILEKIG